MVFASSPTPPPAPKTTPLENLMALPHRSFFFFGIVQCVVFVTLLLAQFNGLVTLAVSTGLYHAYSMTFIIFTQFFVGFLFTTFPRFLSQPGVSKKEFFPIVVLINTGAFLFIPSLFISSMVSLLPMLVIFAGYVKLWLVLTNMYTKSTVTNKDDPKWMLIAFGFGLLSHVLFLATPFAPFLVERIAIDSGFYLYLFLLILVVSQRMIPFFTSTRIQGYVISKSPYFLHLVLGALLLKLILKQCELSTLSADIALFVITTYELIKWKLPFHKAPPILWVLFLSLWWVPLSFGLFAFEGLSGMELERASLHALALGYFTTILIGFGTRIILGHSGRTPEATPYAITVFMLIQITTLVRMFGGMSLSIEGSWYVPLITLSGIIWLVVFGLWTKRYGFILFEK